MQRWDDGFSKWISTHIFSLFIALFGSFLFTSLEHIDSLSNAVELTLTHKLIIEAPWSLPEQVNLSIAIFITFVFIISFLARFWLDLWDEYPGHWFKKFFCWMTFMIVFFSLVPWSYWLAFTVLYTDPKFFLIMISMIIIYFIPSIIAENRRHQNRMAISFLNLLVGWTVIGWLIAIVWSGTTVKHEVFHYENGKLIKK